MPAFRHFRTQRAWVKCSQARGARRSVFRPGVTSASRAEFAGVLGNGEQSAVGAIALPDVGPAWGGRGGASWAPVRVLVALAVLVVCVGGALAALVAGGSGVGALATAPRADGLSALPLAARGPVSAGVGATELGYRVLGFRAGNPAQGLRVEFSRAGVTVASGSGRAQFSLVGFGRPDALAALGGSRPVIRGNRVWYRRAGLTEWYANGPLGLEQGFTVTGRPRAGAGPLVVSLSLAGNLRPRRERGSLLLSGAGALLRYGGLRVVDARARALPSWFSVRDRHISIEVDDRDAAYPLHIDPFIQQGSKLLGSGANGNADQGFSVALSGDGNTALIGGPHDKDSGAAWVFTRSGSTWTQQGPKLVGTGANGDATQGYSVALSRDGNTALIGGPNDQDVGGAAWVFTRSGSTWTQQGPKLIGDNFVGRARQGSSVALSADGNTAVIGGPQDNFFVGAAWVFVRSGSTWTQQGSKLVGSGANGNSRQGYSVALSGDGNTALIGAPFDGRGSVGEPGAAWVYTRSGSTWTQAGSKLVGRGGAGGEQAEGTSVALSADGKTALIGGPGDNLNQSGSVGAAWVFVPFNASRSIWIQQGSKLVGTGAATPTQEGTSVALSADGNMALIGGPEDNYLTGAAWIFARSGSTWTQQGSKLVGSPAPEVAAQGTSVALSGDGNTALIGGPYGPGGSAPGATWVFAGGLGLTAPTRAKLHLAIAGPRTVTAGDIARYRITLSLTSTEKPVGNVLVVSKHAGRRVGRWRVSALRPGQKHTTRLQLRIFKNARGRFCMTTSAAAMNARQAVVRICARVVQRQ